MFLSQLVIHNFRSIESASVTFNRGLNVLVGKNNAGKSNLVEALNVLLGEKWPTYIEFEQRHFFQSESESDSAEKFLIAVRLTGTSFNRQLICEQQIKACIRELPDFPRWERFEDIEELTDGRGDWTSGDALVQFLDGAFCIWFFIIVPRDEGAKNRSFAAYVQQRIGDSTKFRHFIIQRFPKELREALLTTARIPAFRDPSKELRVNNYSWYGKLIRGLYEQRTAQQDIEIKDAQKTLTEIFGDVFCEATKELCDTLKEAIFHHNISFEAGAFTVDESHKNITIFVDDGINTPYYEKGSGIQSALIMALFRYYCTKIHTGGSLLLVEEPELFLHPHARRAIEGQLVKFALSGDEVRSRQVIMTTHSTEFVRSTNPGGLILVSKPPGEIASVVRQVRPGTLDNEARKRWRQIVSTKNAEVFFGDHAILVEGGEEYLLSPLADLVFGTTRWLDSKNITVARVDGKMQFSSYAAILNSYSIPITILTDLDFLRRGASSFADLLDSTERKQLDQLFVRLNELTQQVKAKGIKAALTEPSIDWMNFRMNMDRALATLSADEIPETDVLGSLSESWDKIKQRALKIKLQDLMKDDASLTNLISEVISGFRRHRIFVLKKGELEDYLTQATQMLQPGDASKDRRAGIVGDLLRDCVSLGDADQWLDTNEFAELLQTVDSTLKAPVALNL